MEFHPHPWVDIKMMSHSQLIDIGENPEVICSFDILIRNFLQVLPEFLLVEAFTKEIKQCHWDGKYHNFFEILV